MSAKLKTANSHCAIDLFKFIMALMVVAIHTQPFYAFEGSVPAQIFSSLSRYAVPFFFLASGYLVGGKLEGRDSSERAVILRRYALRLLRLYLLWSLIYAPMALYHYVRDGIPFVKSLLLYVRGLVLLGEHYNSWQLWYLLSLVYGVLLVLGFERLNIKKSLAGPAVCLIMLISICFDALIHTELFPASGMFAAVRTLVSLSIANGKILRGLFYFPAGLWLSRRRIHGAKCFMAFLALYALTWLLPDRLLILGDILFVLSDLMLFCFVSGLQLSARPLFSVLRRMSSAVYFIHMWVFSLLCFYPFRQDDTQGMAIFLATAALSLLLSLPYSLKKVNS